MDQIQIVRHRRVLRHVGIEQKAVAGVVRVAAEQIRLRGVIRAAVWPGQARRVCVRPEREEHVAQRGAAGLGAQRIEIDHDAVLHEQLCVRRGEDLIFCITVVHAEKQRRSADARALHAVVCPRARRIGRPAVLFIIKQNPKIHGIPSFQSV